MIWSRGRKRSGFPLLVLAALPLLAGLSRDASAQAVVNVSAQSLGGSPGSSRHPHMAFDVFGVLHAVWADDTGSAPQIHQIRYARSFDGGVSFTPAIQLSFGNGASLRPRLAVFREVAYVVWMQDPDSGGPKEISFAAVVNGNLVRGPVNLSQSGGISQEARIAVDGFGRIYVLWDESSSLDAPFRHIALARSFDGGGTFVKSVVASIVTPSITTCPPTAVGNCLTVYPGVAVDPVNGNVYAVWHDRVGGPTGEYQVFFTRSLDAGNSFSPPRQVSSAAIHAHCAAITVGPSGRVLIAYETRKEAGVNHYHDSEYQQSLDYGVSFGPPVNVSTSALQHLSDYPWPVEAHDGTIYVAWEDSRFGQLDAVYAVSRDGGGSFGDLAPIVVNGGTSTEVVTAFARDGTALAIWEDEQAGENAGDVFLARTTGVAGPAPGGVQLAIRSNQVVYRSGETLTLGVGAYNTGGGLVVDVYFGMLMPGATGPSLGCPAGDALQLFGDFFASRATTCLSQVPQNTPALLRNFVIPAGMPETAFPNLFAMGWNGSLAPGAYTFIIAVMRAGALDDGRLDPGDVLGAAVQQVLFSP